MEENTVPHSARIYLTDIDLITEDRIASLVSRLNPDELMRYQRFARPLRQRQFLVGRSLLRHLLGNELAVPIDDITLTEQPKRAPLLHIKGVAPVPHFSLSHTGNWVACALSFSIPLGLDIETLDANRNLDAIGEHAFGVDDVAWFRRQPDENKVAAFYQLWSTKEARYKLTQSHTICSTEHCYVLPHPDISIVLMSEHVLSETPQVEFVSLPEQLTGQTVT